MVSSVLPETVASHVSSINEYCTHKEADISHATSTAEKSPLTTSVSRYNLSERNVLFSKLLRREAGAHEIAFLLTPRETDILRMMAHGLYNRQVAEKLFISEGAVKVHLHNIKERRGEDGVAAPLIHIRSSRADGHLKVFDPINQ